MWEMSISPALKVFQLHCSRASKDWKHSCNQDNELQNSKYLSYSGAIPVKTYISIEIFYSTHIISVPIEKSSIMAAESKETLNEISFQMGKTLKTSINILMHNFYGKLYGLHYTITLFITYSTDSTRKFPTQDVNWF
jgi:hypothetical protein